MRLIRIAGLISALLVAAVVSNAQTTSADTNVLSSKYNYHDAFGPFFYTKNGNEYRAASGEPGPKYWQNRADYQLWAHLNDETNEITGTEVLTYINNSPQKLGFIWMQLDQNLFKQNSRGGKQVPLVGDVQVSRNWGKGQVFDAGYKIKSVKIEQANGKTSIYTDVKYIIDDTRRAAKVEDRILFYFTRLRFRPYGSA